MIDFIQVQTTFPDEQSARNAAEILVRCHLVACAQILGPMTSLYRWEGDFQESREWLCLLKTRRMLFDPLAETLRKLHPYDCPQIIATDIVAVESAYGNWLTEQTAHCKPG